MTIIINILLGIAEWDLLMDIRDLAASIIKHDGSVDAWVDLALNIVAFIPVIGSLKYTDEIADAVKPAVKNSDEIADAVKPAIKSSDEIADGVKGVLKSDIADNVDDIGKAAVKNSDEVKDIGKQGIKIVDEMAIKHSSIGDFTYNSKK